MHPRERGAAEVEAGRREGAMRRQGKRVIVTIRTCVTKEGEQGAGAGCGGVEPAQGGKGGNERGRERGVHMRERGREGWGFLG